MIIVASSYLTKKPLSVSVHTILQKVSCAHRKMMNRISTYFPVASKELHAVLEMVANVSDVEG